MGRGLGIVLVNGPVQKKLVLVTQMPNMGASCAFGSQKNGLQQIHSGRQVSRRARSCAWRQLRTSIEAGQNGTVQVPAGMESGDYDVRLAFGEKIIHGSTPSQHTWNSNCYRVLCTETVPKLSCLLRCHTPGSERWR